MSTKPISLAVRASLAALGIVALVFLVHAATAGPAAVLAVRWQPGTTGDVRRAFEREHLLVNAERRGPDNWGYDLLDRSSSNIEAIVGDSRVADTQGVDRTTFVVNDESSDTAWTSALARVPGLRNPVVRGNAVLVLLIVALPGGLVLLTRFGAWLLAAIGAASRAPRWQRGPDEVSWVVLASAAAAVALVTAATRFLTLEMRLTGDDHFGLWIASAVLHGAAPNRDIFDAGVPLTWWLSLLGQWLSGYRVIGEVAIGTLFEAFAFALAFVLTWRVSRSALVATALLPICLILLLATKLYSYPKFFLYPLILATAWGYIARPSTRRMFGLAAGLAVAFLFRHDHGAYTAIGASAAILLLPGGRSMSGLMRVARLGLCTILLLSPWLAWIASTEGLVNYFTARAQLSAAAGIAAARPSFGVTAVGPSPRGFIEPLESARIGVSWTGFDDPQREARERQYGLVPTGQADDGTPTYELRDTTLHNIEALARDPRIDGLTGIDVTSMTPAADAGMFSRWRRQLPLLRLSVLPGYLQRENAAPWIFTLFALLPLAALAVVGWQSWQRRPERFPHERTVVMTASILLVVAEIGLMRKLGGFSDLTTLGMVLGGWLVSLAWARAGAVGDSDRHVKARGLAAIAALALVVLTTAAAASFVRLGTYFEAYTNDHDAGAALATLRKRASDLLDAYTTVPPIDVYAPPGAQDDRVLVRYFRECTNPDDAIWELGGNFAWPYYAERRVVQHPYWFVGFKRTDEDQARTLAWVRDHPAPLVFVKDGLRPLEWLELYPQVHAYVAERYRDASTPALRDLYASDGHRPVWILVDRTRTPTRTFERLGLPCFR